VRRTTTAGSGKDIVDTAVEAGSFATLARALNEAGLVDTPKGPGPQSVRIDAGEKVKVNDANVVKTDIEASNGVIHVIDAVILPD